MMEYRKLLFDRFVTTHYGKVNPAELSDALHNYEIDYRDILPKDREARILDIGCGMGHFLFYLNHIGYKNSAGIDVGPQQIEFCKNHNMNAHLVTDTIDYLTGQMNKLDCIVMNDVIEHLRKDEVIPVIIGVLNALRPGGFLIIRTLNMASVYGPYCRYIDFTHETGFTERSIEQVLDASGFHNIRVRGNRRRFGFKPKRFVRWTLFNVWRLALTGIHTIEVGVDRPRIFDKFLIATAQKAEL